MSRPKQIAAVALSVAGLASMAACGGNDGSSGLTSTSSTATSSSSSTRGSAGPTSSSTTDKTSTPTATGARASIPEAATKRTHRGAEAYVLFYNDRVNQAFRRAAPELLADLGSPGCEFCTGTVGDIEDFKRRGHRYDGDIVKSRIVGSEEGRSSTKVVVVTANRSVPSWVVDARGTKVRQNEKTPTYRLFETVEWTSDGWRLIEVAQS